MVHWDGTVISKPALTFPFRSTTVYQHLASVTIVCSTSTILVDPLPSPPVIFFLSLLFHSTFTISHLCFPGFFILTRPHPHLQDKEVRE
ncbi:hypothetical protein B9Z19DRAFT_1058536 [Tuber borchii]|uniref:Uncharacterized protein n=1 Tax=Tuber borchii TaxID=42251 RepID=A0A2T6ZC98_TUBBO|nr:hypothetical protein B9Z19DRAFT_1058536 [Tuber borchii]